MDRIVSPRPCTLKPNIGYYLQVPGSQGHRDLIQSSRRQLIDFVSSLAAISGSLLSFTNLPPSPYSAGLAHPFQEYSAVPASCFSIAHFCGGVGPLKGGQPDPSAYCNLHCLGHGGRETAGWSCLENPCERKACLNRDFLISIKNDTTYPFACWICLFLGITAQHIFILSLYPTFLHPRTLHHQEPISR